MKQVAGVAIEKISEKVFRDSYKRVFGKPVAGTLEAAVEELSKKFAKDTEGKEVLECSTCGGGSPGALFPDYCPFCGDADEPEGSGEVNASSAVEEEDPLMFEEEDEEEVKAPEKASKKGSKAKPSEEEEAIEREDADEAEKFDTGELAQNLAAEESVAAAKGKKPKRRQAEDSELPLPRALSGLKSEGDLDNAIARVNKSRDAGAAALWALAQELRAIYDQDLWKLRNGEDGKPKYKSFSKFIADEITLHERTVYRMIEVTRSFNEAEAAKYGVSILQGLLAAPAEDRKQILEKIDSGAISGTRSVNNEVKKLREKKGVKVLDSSKDSDAAARAKKAAEAASEAAKKKATITVPFPAGRKTVKLFVRAEKKAEPKRAKKITDRPWGKFEAANGVVLYFGVVQDANGELSIAMEAKRDE